MQQTLLNRRRLLTTGGAVAGAAGIGLTGACGPGSETDTSDTSTNGGATSDICVLTTEMTEGPYYLEDAPKRADVTEGKPGAPLTLRVTVVDASSCEPIDDAAVEIWHCDQWGYYSSYTDNSPGGNVPAEDGIGDDDTFLRGFVTTGADGLAEFTTIVPGWYSGRVTHIHTKVHVGGTVDDDRYEGGSTVHTGQFFFEDDIVLALYELEPYSQHTGGHILLDEDGVYTGGGVVDGLLALSADDESDPMAGYVGTITVGVDAANESDQGMDGFGSPGGA
ncbi:intradiol ring-cleavage dioxygenase [Glycomyces sp. L485]|uniref:intradiol ring-cleavage dioxygenase n=1 Tax=Glycomyces sp. L485 TaxID=2909235 RepID=UPI001F4B815E|nr:intradiol ring-cleavage dioxygenase [Glycomyces sp. L485]MCH7231035.1 intradiol ring-cleavage dioxygenase [Glycomyces sp. L485]